MALQSIGGFFKWPVQLLPGVAYALVSTTLDATTDRIAVVFTAPKAGDLDRMEFRVAGGTALGALRVGWQDVSTVTGYPDGTFDQYADVSGYSAGWQVPAYFGAGGGGSGARRTVTAGERVAFVISPENAVGPNITIGQLNSSVSLSGEYLPATVTNLAGSYSVNNDAMDCALYYSGESSPTPLGITHCARTAEGLVSFSSANPQQVGLRFQVPFKCRVVGAYMYADIDVDITIHLYSSNGTTDLLGGGSGITIDKDVPGANAGILFLNRYFAPVTLDINTTYRLTLENTSATACALKYFDVDDAANIGAWSGGAAFHWTQSDLAHASLVNDASWAQTDTRRPMMGLIIDQLDDGVGGSSGAGPLSRILTGM